MAIKNGIILYSIERNGCLNGLYTHEDLHGRIFNEIARKKNGKIGIEGIYACAYFEVEEQDEATLAFLKISKRPNSRILDFVWASDGKEKFTGVGYQMSKRQISVNYKSGSNAKVDWAPD